VGTRLGDIPDELIDAVVFNERGLSAIGLLRVDLARAIDWLREHPAEAARLLDTRTPTSWDV
jgi:hypothetical protein